MTDMAHDPSLPPSTRRISRGLIAWRWPLLAVAVASAALAAPQAGRLQFDRSIENMFAPDDPLLAPYRRLKRTFGGDEIALAAYVDVDLLTPEGMDRLEKLTLALEQVEGVASAFSLAKVRLLGRYIIDTPLRQRFLEVSEGYTIGADRQTAGILCVLQPESASAIPRVETVDELRRLVDAHDPTGVLTGEPVMVVDGFRYIRQDGWWLAVVSSVLLTLTIGFCFRSLRWMLVSMAVVYVAIVWTQGLLVVLGGRLSMVSSMLWAIVTVIAVATVIHVIVRFRTERDAGHPPRRALEAAAAILFGPICWSCLTDAVGFGSLLVAKVGPVHDFGTMMVIGSLLTLLSIGLVVPGLALLGRVDGGPRRAWGEEKLENGLSRLIDTIQRWPKTLGLLVGGGTAVALVGIGWLQVETDFTKNFRAASPLVTSFDFVESRLGGAGVWDVLVPIPEKPSAHFLPRVRQLEQRLRAEVVVPDEQGRDTPGLTKVLALPDILDTMPGTDSIDLPHLGPTLPWLKRSMPLVAMLHGTDPESENRQFLRIMLRARQRQSSMTKRQSIEQVERISRQEFPDAQVTGLFVLLTGLIESVSRDQWLAFGLAALGIGLMMWVALRSFSLALVALVPNAFPILVLTGIMGWLGLKLNIGGAMIASVSMGLAVDSSIHYITAFKRRRAEGATVYEALHSVHQNVGRAMVFSTLALVVGFLSLSFSEFVPTVYFGVLVSMAMLGGLLGNLVILPLLLKVVVRES